MKTKTIRLVGKHVFENNDELEEGYVEIEVEVYDILREIDSEDVVDYARSSLDMKHEDDFESNLDDFEEDDLIKHLENNNYNFAQKVSEEECIEALEIGGYIITTKSDLDIDLDYVDSNMLEEIEDLFLYSSCAEREEIYNKVINGK